MKKEWKGNGNALHAAIAAKKPESETIREQDDFYATDPKAVEMLIKAAPHIFYSARENGTTIWEPACGTGNIVKLLTKNGFVVYASDLKDRGFGEVHVDFLNTKIDNCPPIILTNPPYSLANEFILHALEILPDGGIYIALMNITYLAGQKRYNEIYSKGSLREVYVFSHRIECWKNGERPKDKCGSICNYAWYVFQKGYKGQPTLYWL